MKYQTKIHYSRRFIIKNRFFISDLERTGTFADPVMVRRKKNQHVLR